MSANEGFLQKVNIDPVTVLFASHSGNGKWFAKKVGTSFEAAGIPVKVLDMAAYKKPDIKDEKNLLVIISTHGEGVPPPSAEELFDLLNGSGAPRLEGLTYSVLALGDKSYVHFCKAGMDLDRRLEELGGKRLSPRVDCDVEFNASAEEWLRKIIAVFRPGFVVPALVVPAQAGDPRVEISTKDVREETPVYSSRKPFLARVLSKVNLNAAGSEKETYHVALSLAGSGIRYQPGDSCGLLALNADKMVSGILDAFHLDGNAVIASSGGRSLKDVLKEYELTVLTPDVIKKHNTFAASKELNAILSDVAHLREYLYGRDFLDLCREYPFTYTPDDLLMVLRPMPARLYSIASSQLKRPDEVHLLVAAVRYQTFGRNKEGVASTFWADRILENELAPVYIKSNEGFRLPVDGTLPVIMVGPGTGVAPFRAFVEERAALGHQGKSWLFFGNPRYAKDFLYQAEWQEHLKNGRLTRMDVAFSRDQKEKIYVQHRILENAKEVYRWIREGAFIYVCGDMKRMAPDVNAAFTQVVASESGLSPDKAVEFVRDLKRAGRYLEDIY